ncbi:MAG: glycosyltransferase family 4 protein [Desulfovibrionaceae bacterium]|nr:glycosyltransferase family 4 protein [Desulfovibrionaceae bacterium]
MKVLVIGNQAQAMANFWTVLMRHLRQANHQVLCCIPKGSCEIEQRLLSVCDGLRTFYINRKSFNPLDDIRTYLDLRRIFKTEQPDVLFLTTIKPVIYGCIAARCVANLKACYATITGLGYAFEVDTGFKRLLNWLVVRLYRYALQYSTGIFFQNPDDLAVFKAHAILQPKVRTLFAKGTGVDTKHFAKKPLPPFPPDAPMTILFVGRLLVAKGLHEFAAAAAAVRQQHKNVRFQILGPKETGPGGLPFEYIEQWQNAGLVEYLGATTDVRSYLAKCHILVLPSWREGLPTCVMEAMSVGRMAIVTDVPGSREVVKQNETGFIVPVKDASALAKAILAAVADPKLVATMGENARRLAETEFDADVVASKIIADMQLEDTRS